MKRAPINGTTCLSALPQRSLRPLRNRFGCDRWLKWGQNKAEFARLFSEPLSCSFAAPLFDLRKTTLIVLGVCSHHRVDDAGEFVGRRGDGFRTSGQLEFHPSIELTQVRLVPTER